MPDNKIPIRLAALLLSVLLVIIVASLLFPPSSWVPAARWGEALQSAGMRGVLVFLLFSTLATAIGLPRQLVAFIGGLAYGTIQGLILSLMPAVLGCLLTVLLSRTLFAGWVKLKYPHVVARLNRLLERDVVLKILVLRLQPLGTNLLTNICVGFTSVSLSLFLVASAVGFVPQMLVFSLLGSGIRVGSGVQTLVSGLLLCISLILGIYLYKKHVSEVSA